MSTVETAVEGTTEAAVEGSVNKTAADKKPVAEKTPFFDDNFKKDAGVAFKAGLCGAITIMPIVLTMAALGRILGSKSEA